MKRDDEGGGKWIGGGGKGSILFIVVQLCLGAFAVSKQA